MGNAVDVRLREDREEFKLTEDLFQQFRDHINRVDYTVTGFAKSVDSMRASCEMLLRQIDINNHPTQDSDISNSSVEVSNMQLSRELLETIHSGVSDHKYVLMESVSKMLHFVWEMGKNLTILSGDRPLEFSVDKYLTLCLAASTNDWDMQNDARTAELEEELTKLPSPYEIAKKEITILNEREVTYREEIEKLEKQVEELTKEQESFTGNQTVQSEMRSSVRSEKVILLDFDRCSRELETSDTDLEPNELKNENTKTKQRFEELKIAKKVNEEALKRKDLEIEELKSSLQFARKENAHNNQSTVDKETSTDDKETSTDDKETSTDDNEGKVNANETKLTEEISLLKAELNSLKSIRVIHVLDYETTLLSSYDAKQYKKELEKILRSEMAVDNLEFKQQKAYGPYKLTGIPTDKPITVPIDIRLKGNLMYKLKRVKEDLAVAPNIAILAFYDVKMESACAETEVPIEGEFKKFGGIFWFSYSSSRLKQHHTEKNKKSLNALLQFLISEKTE